MSWVYLRNYLNIRILLSVLDEFKHVGPWGLDWETEQYKGPAAQIITFVLLAALQYLNLFWLYCLLRSAYQLVVLNIKTDDRSDHDDSEEETMPANCVKAS